MTLEEQIASFVPFNEQERCDRELMLRYLSMFPDLLHRDNPAHFTASSWIVTPAQDKVLMIYHNIYKSWAWTGGHADGEPNLLAVALKEAHEETALAALKPLDTAPYSLEILGVDAHVRKGVYVPTHLHLNLTYLLEAEETATICCNPDENSGVQWVPIEQAVEISTEPCMRVVYQKLIDKLPG